MVLTQVAAAFGKMHQGVEVCGWTNSFTKGTLPTSFWLKKHFGRGANSLDQLEPKCGCLQTEEFRSHMHVLT